jgi:ATP/maltotriose-dependent transcriptional regulator MalT
MVRGYYQECRQRLEAALALSGEVPPGARADALSSLGVLVLEFGENDVAEDLHTRAIALYQEAGNLVGLANVYAALGMLAMYCGDYDRSHDLFEHALVPARRSGDRQTLSNVLGSAAIIAAVDGDYALATGLTREGLSLLRESGDVLNVARTFRYLGYYALWDNDLDGAECMAREGLSMLRELGDFDSLMFAQQLLAQIELERKRYQEANAHFCECLDYLGSRQAMGAAECLEGLAGVAAETGLPARAARLLGGAASLRERADTPLPPPRRERYDRTVGAARKGLSDEAFEAALAEGRSWPLEQAIAYGVEPGDAPPVAPDATRASNLTRRELEVLRLVVDGRSNQEIAASLFISPHTAATHVANIMNKVGVDSRTAAAAWAVRQSIA